MGIQAGVWIDHRKAVVVLLSEEGDATTIIESGIVPPSRSAAANQSPAKHRIGDFQAEDTLERKRTAEDNRFFDEVLACIRDAEAILLLGPSSAKGELRKRVKSKAMLSRIAELETADKMTDRQVAAKVRAHFAEPRTKKATEPTKKAASAKKAAPKKKVAVKRAAAPKKPAKARRKRAK